MTSRILFYVVQSQEEWKARQVDGVKMPIRAGLSCLARELKCARNPGKLRGGGTGKAGTEQGRELAFPVSARYDDQLRRGGTTVGGILAARRGKGWKILPTL